jgi:hypothetical protein
MPLAYTNSSPSVFKFLQNDDRLKKLVSGSYGILGVSSCVGKVSGIIAGISAGTLASIFTAFSGVALITGNT